MANLKGPVFTGELSARHRPSQVTATPQPICVITTAFSHFPDNVLHPNPCSLRPLPCFSNSPLTFSFHPFPLPYIHLLTLLYFSNPLSPIYYFILLLNLLFFFFFLSTVSDSSSCSHYSISSCLCHASSLSLPFSSALLTSESVGF